MPLIKSGSKKAFEKNVKAEDEAGKPQKQSLAIAFSVQRKNKAKKKMKDGGEVKDPISGLGPDKPGSEQEKRHQGSAVATPGQLQPKELPTTGYAKGGHIYSREPAQPAAKPDDHKLREEDFMSKQWAGGPDPIRKPDDQRLPKEEYMAGHFAKGGDVEHESMVDAIMAHRKHLAEGGEVDLEENNIEGPGEDDTQNLEASQKELYDDSQISAQPLDSNEHSDTLSDEDENDRDMISTIIRKLKNKAL